MGGLTCLPNVPVSRLPCSEAPRPQAPASAALHTPPPPPPSHMALKTLNHPRGTTGLQTRAGRADERPREAHPRLPTARGRRGPGLGQSCPPRPASYAATSRRSPLPGGLATQKEGLEEPQPFALGLDPRLYPKYVLGT